MRLIDADALYQSFGASGNCNNCPLDAYRCQYYNEHTLMDFCERIDDAPTVDAEPVRHGHWVDMGDFEQCSVCHGTQLKEIQTYYGKATWIKTPYCPNCGAKMDEGGEQ